MLKPKQKAYLKGLANTLTPIFQIGKDGISEDMIKAILDYLSKHELMKISILNNSFLASICTTLLGPANIIAASKLLV